MWPTFSNLQSRNLTPQQIRRAGWVLIIIGLFMMALMGLVGALLLDFISLADTSSPELIGMKLCSQQRFQLGRMALSVSVCCSVLSAQWREAIRHSREGAAKSWC